MAELSGLQVFKYLPASKKAPQSNCKNCGFPTCMAFALKLAKGQSEIGLCEFVPDELKSIFAQSMKKPQKELFIGGKNKIAIGGENVMFRHDKTFVNKTAIVVVVNSEAELERVHDFDITRVGEQFKIDGVMLKGEASKLLEKAEAYGLAVIDEDLDLIKIESETLPENIEKLTQIRRAAVIEKDEKCSNPVAIYFKSQENMLDLMAKASFYLCKYANMLVFEDFNEALFATLMTLRQNIYTDPQKPLQVESKVYEFNNPDETSLVFLTTNFALTYFAVANEIEELNHPAYLVVTPSDGMSVLTAWSAEKFTAQIVAKTVKNADLANKLNNKQIIIPGLLSHMKEEIEEALPEFKIVVGPNEAYLLGEFVASL